MPGFKRTAGRKLSASRRQEAQSLGSLRHARQCLGVDVGPLRAVLPGGRGHARKSLGPGPEALYRGVVRGGSWAGRRRVAALRRAARLRRGLENAGPATAQEHLVSHQRAMAGVPVGPAGEHSARRKKCMHSGTRRRKKSSFAPALLLAGCCAAAQCTLPSAAAGARADYRRLVCRGAAHGNAGPRHGLCSGRQWTGVHALRAAFARIRDLDARLSDYREDSELNRVSREACKAPAPVSADLFAVLARAVEISARSGGAFDVTSGALTRALAPRPAGEAPARPAAAIAAARRRAGRRHLVLDSANRSLYFRRPGIRLDLGGIAKGYAADQALVELRRPRNRASSRRRCRRYRRGRPAAGEIGLDRRHRRRRQPRRHGMRGRFGERGGFDLRRPRGARSTSTGGFYSHILDPASGRGAPAPRAVTGDRAVGRRSRRLGNGAARCRPVRFRAHPARRSPSARLLGRRTARLRRPEPAGAAMKTVFDKLNLKNVKQIPAPQSAGRLRSGAFPARGRCNSSRRRRRRARRVCARFRYDPRRNRGYRAGSSPARPPGGRGGLVRPIPRARRKGANPKSTATAAGRRRRSRCARPPAPGP